ncbi:unnamed protein product [Menidia menidia]|uniref:(Atlantic silverside) hypothetical protein n=1 Tax=Menidia menidia TaxID=238744 RepID=A0A8S4AD32_9TELE|nr:unnamed protein product [Menidia menidia]
MFDLLRPSFCSGARRFLQRPEDFPKAHLALRALAARYRHRYLNDLDFDNVYVNALFEDLDRRAAEGGGASVLPLTRREAATYISPLLPRLSGRERRAVLGGVASVLRNAAVGGLLVALDFLVFWILDQVHHQVKSDVVARAPVSVEVQVNGSGYASDIFRDLVASFNVLQGGNITVFSRKCLLEPAEPDYSTCFLLGTTRRYAPVSVEVQVNGSGYASDIFRDLVASFNVLQGGNITVFSRKCLLEPAEPDYSTCFLLGFLLGLALLVSVGRGFAQRCRRLICAAYHPERELERISYLHQQILEQRRALGRALRTSGLRKRAGKGGPRTGPGTRTGPEPGTGPGPVRRRLQALLTRPLLSRLLGPAPGASCLSCDEKLRLRDEDTVTCEAPGCPGNNP